MIDRTLSWTTRRFGHRGSWLIVMGAMWLCLGAAALLTPTPPRPWVLHEMLPPLVLASVWIATGLFAIITGLRGTRVDDRLGHAALYFMPLMRVVSYALAFGLYVLRWIVERVDPSLLNGPLGWADGWFPAVVWLVIVVLLALGARWPNPSMVLPMPPPDAAERLERDGGAAGDGR